MPPALIGAVIITTAAVAVKTVIEGSIARKTAEKGIAAQERAAGQMITSQEKIAQQQAEQAAEEARIVEESQAKQAGLSEKQMILESQGMQITTLANLISSERAIAPATPVIMQTPSRQIAPSFFQQLNQYIDNLFRG